MKNTILLFLLVLPFYFLQAKKFVKADIEYTNGTTKTVFVGFPIKVWSKEVKFKKSESAKIESVNSEAIYSITFANNTNFATLIFTSVKHYRLKKEKVGKRKVWLLVHYACKDVQALTGAEVYKINKKGDLILETTAGMFYYYFKEVNKPNSPAALVDVINAVSNNFMIGRKNNMRVYTSRFFAKYPDIVKEIESKEFDNAEEVLDYYCQKEE